LRCVGANDAGQLGDSSTVDSPGPVVVRDVYDVADVALGGRFTCAVVGLGRVSCFGANDLGQLGDGTTTSRVEPRLTDDAGGVALTNGIAAGEAHACARLSSGGVRCWGSNMFGQLGDGTTTIRLRPVEVPNLRDATGITAGSRHTCATSASGVFCWGANENGQLGSRAP
jgi:alpha-tubulin suppressor-like RCC1 family protein